MSFSKFRKYWQHVSQTIPAFVCVLLLFSMTDGEGTVSFEMSIEELLSNGFTVSAAIATLENHDFSRSIELEIEDSKIHGTIADLPDGKYTFHLELQDGNSTIAKSSASGYLRLGEAHLITARTDLSCQKVTTIIDWDPTNSTDVEDFFSFSISPDSVTLKTYEGIENIETLAAEHAADGLQWFYRHRIWSNLDSNLVPIVQYNFGEHRNPLTTSHTALAFYDKYLGTNDPMALQGFFNNADWLLENHNGEYYFLYNFEWRHFSAPLMRKGWISAMAQGQALGAISIAYHLTGEEKYLEAATGVFNTLHTNSDTLWCFGIDDEDYYWLEEYPTTDFCHVLNGKLFGLFGIWTYYVISQDQFALTLFKAGMRTFIDNHSRWNVRNQDSSRYCWHGAVFPNYHQVHLVQLERYDIFFDIPEFREIVRCFSNTFVTSIDLPESAIVPGEFVLDDNYPNPFNASTVISFKLPNPGLTKLTIFNIRGQKVDELLNERLDAGDYQVRWNATKQSSGVYVYTVQNGDLVLSGRMTLVK